MVAFDEADDLFAQIEPVRRWQVASHRSRTLHQAGQLDEARRGFEQYAAWCRRQESHLGEADACLFLASLECEAGRTQAAEVAARQAIAASDRAGNDHLLHHGRLTLGLAQLLQGHPDRALKTLETVDSTRVTSFGKLALWTRSAVAHRLSGPPNPGVEAALDACLTEMHGQWAEQARILTAAGRNGTTSPSDGLNPELRLVALAWQLLA